MIDDDDDDDVHPRRSPDAKINITLVKRELFQFTHMVKKYISIESLIITPHFEREGLIL